MSTALKRHRLARRLTQEQVAAIIGVSQSTVVNYEAGNSYPLNADVQRKLRKLFRTPLPVLLAPENGNGGQMAAAQS